MFSVILIIFWSFWLFSKMQSSCESYPAKLKLPLLPRIKIYSPQKALVWDIEGQWWLITSYQTLSQSDSGSREKIGPHDFSQHFNVPLRVWSAWAVQHPMIIQEQQNCVLYWLSNVGSTGSQWSVLFCLDEDCVNFPTFSYHRSRGPQWWWMVASNYNLQSCCKKLDILYIEMAGSYWYPVAC